MTKKQQGKIEGGHQEGHQEGHLMEDYLQWKTTIDGSAQMWSNRVCMVSRTLYLQLWSTSL